MPIITREWFHVFSYGFSVYYTEDLQAFQRAAGIIEIPVSQGWHRITNKTFYNETVGKGEGDVRSESNF